MFCATYLNIYYQHFFENEKNNMCILKFIVQKLDNGVGILADLAVFDLWINSQNIV